MACYAFCSRNHGGTGSRAIECINETILGTIVS
ncbi:hypothetical protein [Veillonella caviae]